MKIKINDNWQIRTDPYNFILCRMGTCEKGVHAGELVSHHEHYFPTLGQALNFAREKLILTSEAEDWGDVCEMVTDFQAEVLDAIRMSGVDNCAVLDN